MLRTQPLDAADDAQYAGWYSVLRAAASAGRHAPLVVSAETMRAQLLRQTRAVRTAFGAYDGATCVGTAVLEHDTEHNVHLGDIDVNVSPEHRRRGIGSRLLLELSDAAAAAGLTTLLGEVVEVEGASPGLEFARRHDFASVHTEHRLVLDLPLSADRSAQLAGTSDATASGYTLLTWSGPTPEQYRATMAQLRTGMNAEVPTGEVDADPEIVTVHSLAAADRRLEERGYLSLLALVIAPDGSPAGYSHLLVQGDDPLNAIQDDTYVLAPHRGHRIGTWLKATNLDTLGVRVPAARHVHTWTDETNDAMYAINAAFGFRAVETMHEVQRGSR